jgi:predicted RNA-binding protein
MEKNYWLDLFTPETWEEASKIGYTITGFRRHRWKGLARIKQGDVFACYLTKISRFCGLLEAASEPFFDETPIWKIDPFPARVRTIPLVTLQPAFSIPFDHLTSEFVSAKAWLGYIRGSPIKLPTKDGQVIERALLDAVKSPREFPLPSIRTSGRRGRPRKRPATLDPKAPLLTVPAGDPVTPVTDQGPALAIANAIQSMLVQMGIGMRLSVWVGRDSRNKVVGELRFADVCLSSLPQQFDPSTTKVIEYIDVLWLDGNAIVAAFEIERSTSIYSGLLRMSELVSMQPNIDILLYIVADDEKRDKVRQEINRPTFRMLRRSMVEICRFIPYSKLSAFFESKKDELGYLRHEIVREKLAEDCSLR